MTFLDGTICHALTQENELARFSAKSQRLVLLAYHDTSHAYVYPLSTAKSDGAIRLDRPGAKHAWLVVRNGLFRVPLSALTETAHRWSKFGVLRERIQRDLEAREVRGMSDSADLTHRALESLSELRGEVSQVKTEKPKPPELTDEELFQQYLDRLGP